MATVTRNWAVDLNNDGRLDNFSWTMGFDRSTVDPSLSTPSGQSHFTMSHGLHVSTGMAYTFGDKQKTDVRFHATEGLSSFAVNEQAGYYDTKGTFLPIHIDGFAIGTYPAAPFAVLPQNHPLVHDASGRIRNWAFELKAGKVVTGDNDRPPQINEIFWTIEVGGKSERVDPNRAIHNDKCVADDQELKKRGVKPDVIAEIQRQTESEKLIQPLLTEAAKLNKKHFTDAQKRVVVLKLEKIASQWKVNHPQSDPRVKQITDPILWNGILGAMAKLAGLAPVDFPG